MSKIKVYLASGWFTPKTVEILDKLESKLSNMDTIELYSPRRDGIMLPPNQKHDSALRESIFKENIQHITSSDIVLANIESTDNYNDPGTMYEVGYAMAQGVPVIGYATSGENIQDRFKGLLSGFEAIVYDDNDLDEMLSSLAKGELEDTSKKRVLFVGNGNAKVDGKIASHIVDNGYSIRWINELHDNIYPSIDQIFEGVEFMVAIVDDRKTLVSWMIGQAYARGIPVVTYSDFNYGVNVMLLVSLLTHIRGTDELNEFLQLVKREGLAAVPPFDISQLDSM